MSENEQLPARVVAKAHNTRAWGRPSLTARADAPTLARAEATLGFTLPPLLADLCLSMGDGGFGTDCGLLPLPICRAERGGGDGPLARLPHTYFGRSASVLTAARRP
ncbi:hypothetical protein JYK17_09585 [Streptomyces sp. KC 17012]|uniref:hypothetical protein n=1 Tax=Streptomyces TaxID=1883 RepID=UPI001C9D83E5|nr:hypothetical protein [Streptomyces plumbidurans]MBY8340293.1 hypothetical protein [Streptomyces plumbidurans]